MFLTFSDRMVCICSGYLKKYNGCATAALGSFYLVCSVHKKYDMWATMSYIRLFYLRRVERTSSSRYHTRRAAPELREAAAASIPGAAAAAVPR